MTGTYQRSAFCRHHKNGKAIPLSADLRIVCDVKKRAVVPFRILLRLLVRVLGCPVRPPPGGVQRALGRDGQPRLRVPRRKMLDKQTLFKHFSLAYHIGLYCIILCCAVSSCHVFCAMSGPSFVQGVLCFAHMGPWLRIGNGGSRDRSWAQGGAGVDVSQVTMAVLTLEGSKPWTFLLGSEPHISNRSPQIPKHPDTPRLPARSRPFLVCCGEDSFEEAPCARCRNSATPNVAYYSTGLHNWGDVGVPQSSGLGALFQKGLIRSRFCASLNLGVALSE